MSIFIFRSVFILYSLRWANASQNWASLLRYRISFRKRFFLQTHSGTSCTARAKVLCKVCLWVKILLSIANSTSKCSAQNLGSKVTNRRSWKFPERSWSEVTVSNFFEHVLSGCFNVIGCLRKYFAIFCSQLVSVVIGQFSSKWPGPSSCTVK